MPVANRSRRIDLWFVVAAGPGPWLDGERPEPLDQLVLTSGLASALVLSLAVTSTAGAALHFRTGLEFALFGTALGALVAVCFGVSGRLRKLAPGAVVFIRALAALGVLAMTVKAYGSVQPLLLGGFGLAAGANATVALRAVGAAVRWPGALRRFILSTVHAGVLTGAVFLALLPATRSLRGDLAHLGLTLYAIIATSTMTMAGLSVLLARIDSGTAAHVASIRAAMRREQAHWLHDDVCSELGHLRLRLQDGPMDPDALRSSLDDLDHRLRIRQIDEILEGGPARLGEIIQPYLRVAQSHGVELSDVPTYETGAMLLSPVAGRQVQRALAVLTANAIQAGARELAVRTLLDPDGLVIEIEDDAGGFEFVRPIPGRGLDGLARDLGPGRLEIVRTSRGTVARARVALTEDFVSA